MSQWTCGKCRQVAMYVVYGGYRDQWRYLLVTGASGWMQEFWTIEALVCPLCKRKTGLNEWADGQENVDEVTRAVVLERVGLEGEVDR